MTLDNGRALDAARGLRRQPLNLGTPRRAPLPIGLCFPDPMLHAILRGKLAEHIPEPQRLEDALTSTVFGTLLLANAAGVLARWLSEARTTAGKATAALDAPAETAEAWFWPRLRWAEPDLILRIGNNIVVIEAKYRSGKHDHAVAETDATSEGPVALADQLCRQVRSIEDLCNGGWCSEAGLTRAVQNARLRFLYIVDERRLRRCMREFRASVELAPPEADLRILTWQRLHRLLHLTEDCGSHWASPLRDYLEYAGLDAYCGIHSMNRTTASACSTLKRWRVGASGRNGRWAVMAGFRRSAAVERWRFGPPRFMNLPRLSAHARSERQPAQCIAAWCDAQRCIPARRPLMVPALPADSSRSWNRIQQFRFRKSSND